MSFLVRVGMLNMLIYHFLFIVMVLINHFGAMVVVLNHHTIMVVVPTCVSRAVAINNV